MKHINVLVLFLNIRVEVLNEWSHRGKTPGFVFKNIHRKCILLLSDQDNAVGKTQINILNASNEEKEDKKFAE